MYLNEPAYLNLLLLIILLILLPFYRKRRKNNFEKIGHKKSSPILPENITLLKRRRFCKDALLILAFAFLMLAIAGPKWGLKEETIERRGIDIVVAIDLSRSMLTEDISPNRIERAKLELSSFIDSRRGDRLGIVAFAGSAFVACPLTVDYGAAKNFLAALKPGMIPTPGTDLAGAINLSLDLFKGYAEREGVIVLLTDGEETVGTPLNSAEKAAADGASIYTLGFGTKTGGPIPIFDKKGKISDYKKDRKGDIVISRVDGALLKKIADIGGGMDYYGADAVRQLKSELAQKEKDVISSKVYSHMEEKFQYPLLLAFLFLSIEMLIHERKKRECDYY